jgi:hypothetical protein
MAVKTITIVLLCADQSFTLIQGLFGILPMSVGALLMLLSPLGAWTHRHLFRVFRSGLFQKPGGVFAACFLLGLVLVFVGAVGFVIFLPLC